MVEPNREDMERAKIVLDDALPYELDMLDAAARYIQTDEFSKLTKPTTEIEWLTCNAIVEAFWTHARCLIEFFSRQPVRLDAQLLNGVMTSISHFSRPIGSAD